MTCGGIIKNRGCNGRGGKSYNGELCQTDLYLSYIIMALRQMREKYLRALFPFLYENQRRMYLNKCEIEIIQ